jgi:hypothetical protein
MYFFFIFFTFLTAWPWYCTNLYHKDPE